MEHWSPSASVIPRQMHTTANCAWVSDSETLSFRIVLNVMAKCQQSTLKPIPRQLSRYKSWAFPPGCKCDIDFAGAVSVLLVHPISPSA